MKLIRVGDRVKFERLDILGNTHNEIGTVVSERFCLDNSSKIEYHIQSKKEPYSSVYLRSYRELETFENCLFDEYSKRLQSILKNE
jgi:hypothetical protein